MALAEPQPLDITFTAPIRTDGPFARFLLVERSAELLGTGRAVKVVATFDGHEAAVTLMPSGTGEHLLPLRAAICTAIGKGEQGDEVTVHLTQRTT
ncbi:uncharacterized protein DUF1905 [Sediminihabitans luteus]|uniref:Uncharacterized protein DUF1905 n=1 Tax=Sediminihabitans luteus TaxID=1138585 RepID=A0A2M9D1G9_9CELL|nr:DUF1905 domain-containing protein [Sediminihabitans luteus]PJJ77925.1 uncharacterized protein DUF1905 [Sediminihabitans luteus]GII99718.1 hypothetical protein Slu03_20960 [Sediminihabitans luteus]